MKNIILKLGIGVLAALIAGNGYELLNEVRELKAQAERTERAFVATTQALETVAEGLRKTREAATSVTSQCSAAHSEAIRVRSSVEKLHEQIVELRRKLRAQAPAF